MLFINSMNTLKRSVFVKPNVTQIFIILRILFICCVREEAVNLGFGCWCFRPVGFFRLLLFPCEGLPGPQVQSDPHANCEYVGVRISGPAWVRSAHHVRKFSLNFHRTWRSAAGRNWLPVLRSAVPICPRHAGGPPADRRRGLTPIPCVHSQKIAFRHVVDLGNAWISHWSFRRVTSFESRGICKHTGCLVIFFHRHNGFFLWDAGYKKDHLKVRPWWRCVCRG